MKRASRSYLRGFSLMEILVALAILSLSFVSLFLIQTRATKLALEARNITIATQLARVKLLECMEEVKKIVASASEFEKKGEYEGDYQGFKWACYAPKMNLTSPSASKIQEQLQLNKEVSQNSTASNMAPSIITMITGALSDAIRELVVFVTWEESGILRDVKVVTHVTDLSSVKALSQSLKQGAQALSGGKKKPKDKNKDYDGQ